jgi:L-aminopeptidase/D-esterase-like protein
MSELRDITGVFVANATDHEGGTGCTVICCPSGATGGVDVRGGAPATRETDLLRPEETVDVLHAVVLSGGSAFGLASACGVADELSRRDIGLDVGVCKVPIVSSACVFDLACGDASSRPTSDMGADACARALDGSDELEHGNVGAGTGCTVGKLAGMDRAMKGGLGTHVESAGGIVCQAFSAVNACGNVRDPRSGTFVAGMRETPDSEVIVDEVDAMLAPRTNTTISCIVTNAALAKAQATKVAQMSADAYAHAICPTHTTNDGDTVFVMATGEMDAPVDLVGVLATRALELAIVDGCLSARGAYGIPGAARDKGNES